MATSLTRFDPVARMLRSDPFRSFDDFFSDLRTPSLFRAADMAPRIRMDVTESDQAYKVKAELPGAKKEDIKVNIDGNQVSIAAETRSENEQGSGTAIWSERSWGQYYRSFTLPQPVDDAQARAEFRDGVLELELPKKSGGTGKPLAIA
jgi:HSP20 family protein